MDDVHSRLGHTSAVPSYAGQQMQQTNVQAMSYPYAQQHGQQSFSSAPPYLPQQYHQPQQQQQPPSNSYFAPIGSGPPDVRSSDSFGPQQMQAQLLSLQHSLQPPPGMFVGTPPQPPSAKNLPSNRKRKKAEMPEAAIMSPQDMLDFQAAFGTNIFPNASSYIGTNSVAQSSSSRPRTSIDVRADRVRKHNQAEVKRRKLLKIMMDDLADKVGCRRLQKTEILRATLTRVELMKAKLQSLGVDVKGMLAEAEAIQGDGFEDGEEDEVVPRSVSTFSNIPPTMPGMDHQLFFHSATVAMDIVDARGNILDCNAAFVQFTGYPREVLINPGTTFLGLTHPDSLQASFRLMSGLISGGKSVTQEHKKYVNAKGDIRNSLVTCWLVTPYRLNAATAQSQGPLIQAMIQPIDDNDQGLQNQRYGSGAAMLASDPSPLQTSLSSISEEPLAVAAVNTFAPILMPLATDTALTTTE